MPVLTISWIFRTNRPRCREAGKVFAPHDHLRDLAGKIADRSGGKPVRPHTERIRPFDFEQIGHLFKDGRDPALCTAMITPPSVKPAPGACLACALILSPHPPAWSRPTPPG